MIEFVLKTEDHNKYNLNVKQDYGDWKFSEVSLKQAYLFKLLYNLRPKRFYSSEWFFDIE
jgi:hypothetical protein